MRVKIENGHIWVPNIEKARELRGAYYIIEETTLHRLVDGVYDAAVEKEVDKEVYIDIESMPNVEIVDKPPFRIPSQIANEDMTYYIDREMMVVPEKLTSIRWIVPELELEELLDEEKGI